MIVNDSLDEHQLIRLVDRLVTSHRRSPINYFIERKFAKSTSQMVKEARIARERGSLVTQIHFPWDRRPDESARQYQAFTYYRDQGADRQLRSTAYELNLGESSVQLWRRRYDWAARVRSYDEHEEKRLRKVAERAKKEMVERQARLGQTMTERAQDTLDAQLVVPESVADVVRLAEAGTRIERLARGESTENVAGVTKLILAHPLPPWAPESAKQLVEESVYGEGEGGNEDGDKSSKEPVVIDGDVGNINK